jgi:predicted nucleic acid-binding protein
VVDALLDTAVVVDMLRGHPPATAWLATQRQLGVTTIVWLEIIEGTPNRRAQRIALRLLQGFERVDVTSPDIDWAIRQLVHFNLSHGGGCYGLFDRFGEPPLDCSSLHP